MPETPDETDHSLLLAFFHWTSKRWSRKWNRPEPLALFSALRHRTGLDPLAYPQVRKWALETADLTEEERDEVLLITRILDMRKKHEEHR